MVVSEIGSITITIEDIDDNVKSEILQAYYTDEVTTPLPLLSRYFSEENYGNSHPLIPLDPPMKITAMFAYEKNESINESINESKLLNKVLWCVSDINGFGSHPDFMYCYFTMCVEKKEVPTFGEFRLCWLSGVFC